MSATELTPDAVQVGQAALTLRDIAPSDRAAVLALHTLVFGPDVDAAWFDWKYGAALAQGRGQGVGAWHDGVLIAFCGGVPRTLWRDGRRVCGLQIGDVMVQPAWRGILTRRGPFFYVSQHLYESQLGALGQRPFQLGFGFPSARHLRLAVLRQLLHDGGVIEALYWPSAATPALPWHWRWQALTPTQPDFERIVNRAWQAMQVQAGGLTLGQRDAAYVRWRYTERPPAVGTPAEAPKRYRFYVLRRAWPGSAVGVAVLDVRAGPAHWLDWIGPIDWINTANQACRLEAARVGAAELTTWASPVLARQLAPSGIERRHVCAGFGLPVSSDLQAPELTSLQWWLMGGDTDFL